jgi:hypothetical protein
MPKLRLFLLLAVVFSIGAAPLRAGVIFQFDELGDISYSIGGSPYVALPNGVVKPDFTGGVASYNVSVLVYNLTAALASKDMMNGDVPIEGTDGLVGDLRFTDANADSTRDDACSSTVQCFMIFYVFDSNGNAADVGPVSTSFLWTQTVGTELATSTTFSYTAGNLLTYNGSITTPAIIFNVTPEPAPAVMLLFGAAAFLFIHKRSK